MRSGQWFHSPEGTRWHFDAGAVSLDFGYTGDFGWGRPEWERLAGRGDLTEWLRRHVHPAIDAAADFDLDQARRLRAALVAAARALVAATAIAAADASVVNRAAARPDIPPQLPAPDAEGPRPTVDQALSVIARDFITTSAAHPDRIRTCAADDCHLVFYDASRPGTRRWCSMQRCGNRAKVRHHRAHTST